MDGGSRFFFGKAKKAAFRVDLSMIEENTFDDTQTNTNLSAGITWKFGTQSFSDRKDRRSP